MTKLSFTKMHGLGNDFVVFDALQAPLDLGAEQVRAIADRHFGIGCDQVLIIAPPRTSDADARFRIFNADGCEVEQCGNGVRCVGDYLRRHALIDGDSITLETIRGQVTAYLEAKGQIRVDMGVPNFEPRAIPLSTGSEQLYYPLSLDNAEIEIIAVSMGNPHAVLIVPDVEQVAVSTLGPAIQQHKLFPRGVNVGFMEIVDTAHIRLRVCERGVGETLACGSGACGAVAAGIIAGRLADAVDVELKGGNLSIRWAGKGQTMWMSGPATTVYEGQIVI